MANRGAAAILMISLLGLPAQGALLEDTIATVNGKPVLLSEYRKELDAAMEHWRRNLPAAAGDKQFVAELKRKVLDQLVDKELLWQESEKRKLKVHEREIDKGIAEVRERNFQRDEAGKALSEAEAEAALVKELKREGLSLEQFRDRIRRDLLIRKVIESAVRPEVKPPAEADLRTAFDKLKFLVQRDTSAVSGMPEEEAQAYLGMASQMKNLTSERVRISHILLKLGTTPSLVEKSQALKKAQALKKRVEEGEDFAELARKESDDAESAARGGDLGAILKGWMPAEFEKAAFGSSVGEVAGPVETEFGYHLIRVVEKRASESLNLEKFKDDVAQFLYSLRQQRELEKLVKNLRGQGVVEVNLPKELEEPSEGASGPVKKN